MQLRVKTLEYNEKGQLDELDLGPAPWGVGVPDGRFSYTFEGRTYSSCYVEFEPKPPQPTGRRLLSCLAMFAISVGAAFVLSLIAALFNR